MVVITAERRGVYDALAQRVNALIGSAQTDNKGPLTHLVMLTGTFQSAEDTHCNVSVSRTIQGQPEFNVLLDLGLELTDELIAEARSEMQERLHGTVRSASRQTHRVILSYNSTPDPVYLAWAEPAKNYIKNLVNLDGTLGKRDQEFTHPVTTIQGRERAKTGVQVVRRMGEAGFTVKFSPYVKKCLSNGKTWTENGAVAALKHSLPEFTVTSVFDPTHQQVIATVTPITL